MCASPTLPFGTVLTVVNNATGASTVCTVDDREGAGYPRVVDLSPIGLLADRRPRPGSGGRHNLLVTLSGADIAQLLSAHGLRPSRALGQNFVADPNTVRRIARLSGAGPGSQVLEIGAGLGSLTLALAETGAERGGGRDGPPPGPRPAVRRRGRRGGDGRGGRPGLDLAALLAERSPGPWSLVANLPYNVATPLVLKTLVEVPAVAHLLVMVQREVGERMAAGRRRGRLRSGLGAHRLFRPGRGGGPGAGLGLHPAARVESVLVRLDRRPEPAVDPSLVSYDRLNAVVRAGFAQRRKMLRRSLAGVVDPAAFERAGVRPDARAEELDVAAWGRLAAL